MNVIDTNERWADEDKAMLERLDPPEEVTLHVERPFRADLAVGEVRAEMQNEEGESALVAMGVGVPVLVDMRSGALAWTSAEPVPLSPVGFRVGQFHLRKLMREMRRYWPEVCDATDWSILLDPGPESKPALWTPEASE